MNLDETKMNDCISRQAVLDLAYTIKTDDYSDNQLLDIVEVDDIKALPPVNPKPCGDAVSRQVFDEIKELMTDINGDTVYAVRMSDIRQLPPVNPQEKTGHCEDCRDFRKLPMHAGTIGKCIQHAGFCPKGNWYCADFEPQERSDKECI